MATVTDMTDMTKICVVPIISFSNLLVILDVTVALNKLSNFIGSMASEKKIVCWSYGQGETHKETRVHTEGCKI